MGVIPREETYKNSSKLLNDSLNILNGRTIIYIQKKSDSVLLKKLINSKIDVIDFCLKTMDLQHK